MRRELLFVRSKILSAFHAVQFVDIRVYRKLGLGCSLAVSAIWRTAEMGRCVLRMATDRSRVGCQDGFSLPLRRFEDITRKIFWIWNAKIYMLEHFGRVHVVLDDGFSHCEPSQEHWIILESSSILLISLRGYWGCDNAPSCHSHLHNSSPFSPRWKVEPTHRQVSYHRCTTLNRAKSPCNIIITDNCVVRWITLGSYLSTLKNVNDFITPNIRIHSGGRN